MSTGPMNNVRGEIRHPYVLCVMFVALLITTVILISMVVNDIQPPKYKEGDLTCLTLTDERVQVTWVYGAGGYIVRLPNGRRTTVKEYELKDCQ